MPASNSTPPPILEARRRNCGFAPKRAITVSKGLRGHCTTRTLSYGSHHCTYRGSLYEVQPMVRYRSPKGVSARGGFTRSTQRWQAGRPRGAYPHARTPSRGNASSGPSSARAAHSHATTVPLAPLAAPPCKSSDQTRAYFYLDMFPREGKYRMPPFGASDLDALRISPATLASCLCAECLSSPL